MNRKKTYKQILVGLAKDAGKIMRKNFALGMKKEWKEDNTPLTITDTTINKLVIRKIRKNFPTHSILGEEESFLQESEYTWVCDPVDGTIPFSHGYPAFMFSLALVKNGVPIAGVLYDPILKRLFYAEKGKGAFLNGVRTRVSKKTELKGALVGINSRKLLDFIKMMRMKHEAFPVMFHGSTYGASLVACGEFIAEVYGADKPWDAAAVKIIVEEAGGKVTDLYGNEQRYDGPIHGSVATNGLVHEEILKEIKASLKK
ncbi:MAG: inositol monophosphatase [Patescibacteria group bacterium]